MRRASGGMLQAHHGVRIMDEAIVESVRLSSRYMPGRQLPDKSVSLLDTACARVALSQSATPASVEDTQRDIEQISTTLKSLARENASLGRSEEHTSELQSRGHLVCRLLLEKKKKDPIRTRGTE